MTEKPMNTAGKKEITKEIRKLTRELYGKSWTKEEASYTYDIIIESIKRSFFENGRIVIEGIMSMEMVWKEDSLKYDPIKNDGTYMEVPSHNKLRIIPSECLKRTIKKMDVKFNEDYKIKRGVNRGIDPREKVE